MSKAKAAVVIPIERARVRERARIAWCDVEDERLVDGMVENDMDAWAEFEIRYGQVIKKRIAFVLSRCSRKLRCEDTLDEIRSEVLISLLTNDKARLRAFERQSGTLKHWVALISQCIAINEVKRLIRIPMPVPKDKLGRLGRRGQKTQVAHWWAAGA